MAHMAMFRLAALVINVTLAKAHCARMSMGMYTYTVRYIKFRSP